MPFVLPLIPLVASVVGGTLGIVLTVVGTVAGFFLSSISSGNSRGGVDQQQRIPTRQAGIKQEIRSPSAHFGVPYGRARVGYVRIHAFNRPGDPPGGNEERIDSGRLVLACGWGHGGIEEVEKIFFDERPVWDSTTGFDRNRLKASDGSGRLVLKLEHNQGRPQQSASQYLLDIEESRWTADHKLGGIAFSVLDMLYDQNRFPNGLPRLTAVLKGRRVWDPRINQLVYSDNPVLCLRDYMTDTVYGCSIPSSQIDDTTVIAEANYCEEQEYTCNGIVDTGQDRRTNLNEIASSGRVNVAYMSGTYRFFIRKVQPTVDSFAGYEDVKLTEDNIVNLNGIRTPPSVDRLNQVRINYVNAVQDVFEEATLISPAKSRRDNLVKEDGNIPSSADIDLLFTTSRKQANDIGTVLIAEARQGIQASMLVNEVGLTLAYGDVVKVTHSTPAWTEKPFWVEKISLRPDRLVELVLLEYEPTAYQPFPLGTNPEEEDTDLKDPSISLNPVITFIDGSEAQLEVTPTGEIRPTFLVRVENRETFLEYFEWLYRRTGTTQWLTSGTSSSEEFRYRFLTEGFQYDIGVTAVTVLGIRSVISVNTGNLLEGRTASPPDVDAFFVDRSGTNELILTWTYSTPPLDLDGFIIRYHESAFGTWGNAIDIGIASKHARGISLGRPVSSGSFNVFIKAVDTTGNQSENAAIVQVGLGGRLPENLVQETDYQALGYPGTLAGLELLGGRLVSTAQATGFVYSQQQAYVNSGAAVQRYSGQLGAHVYQAFQTLRYSTQGGGQAYGQTTFDAGLYEFEFVPNLSGPTYINLTGAGTKTIDIRTETSVPRYSGGPTDTAYTGVPTALVYSPPIPTTYHRFVPGRVLDQGQKYTFRISTFGGSIPSEIDTLTVVLDFPDIVQTFDDFPIPTVGARLTPTKPFTAIKAVVYSIQRAGNQVATGEVTDKQNVIEGPFLQLFVGNQPTSGVVDVTMVGY